jgi:hypothetical protein
MDQKAGIKRREVRAMNLEVSSWTKYFGTGDQKTRSFNQGPGIQNHEKGNSEKGIRNQTRRSEPESQRQK